MLFAEEYMFEEEGGQVVGLPDQYSKRYVVAQPGQQGSSLTSLERLHKLIEAAYLRVVGLMERSEHLLRCGKIYLVRDYWLQRP